MKSWENAIPLMKSGYHQTLLDRVAEMRQNKIIYPPQEQILFALEKTPFSKVKVVILGQDPYPNEGQAHGLAFSVPEGVKTPRSLRNIFKEITNDVYQGQPQNFSTDLTRWAGQGVLLLNSILTVEAKKAGSHKNLGWQQLTDEIVEQLSDKQKNLVFLLWGTYAQSKRGLIAKSKHMTLEAAHPSPLSAKRGFFGCQHFSKTNAYLQKHNIEPIKW